MKRSEPSESQPNEPRPSPVHELFVGPAGWSYPDWSGYVYPSPRPKGFHEATYLAQFFDTIEINTSFYHPMRPDHARLWLGRVSENPRFLFTAKLWQRFTHLSLPDSSAKSQPLQGSTKFRGGSASIPSPPRTSRILATTDADDAAVRAGFDVLHESGKLGAVLLQFPFSFHRTTETFDYLATLLRRFSVYSLAVELRHASWNDPLLFALLREQRAAFCNIDQPIIGRSIEPSDQATSPIGYVRFHGRRYDTWFSDDPATPPHERYNYLYSPEELAPWTQRIRSIVEQTRKTFVVTNNHYLGKGVVNALQIIAALKSIKLPVPEPLRHRYPVLESIASEPPATPSLFPA
jgi:uncharacterized protein YecE (DUF72 family)